MIPGAQADVYLGHGKYMLEAVSRTVDGLWVAMAPWDQLPDSASDTDLGRAIKTILDGSRLNAPSPELGVSANAYGREFLTAMGFRSLSQLTRGTRAVLVVEDGHRIRACVSGRDGLNTGELVWSTGLGGEEVARAVRTALDRSQVIWE
jgi:hypothetical protein